MPMTKSPAAGRWPLGACEPRARDITFVLDPSACSCSLCLTSSVLDPSACLSSFCLTSSVLDPSACLSSFCLTSLVRSFNFRKFLEARRGNRPKQKSLKGVASNSNRSNSSSASYAILVISSAQVRALGILPRSVLRSTPTKSLSTLFSSETRHNTSRAIRHCEDAKPFLLFIGPPFSSPTSSSNHDHLLSPATPPLTSDHHFRHLISLTCMSKELKDSCKFAKEGIVWFEECTLRYANRTFFFRL